MAALNVEYQQ